MNFEKITKYNLKSLYPWLYQCDYGLCDYAPMVLLLWSEYYDYRFAIEEEGLFLSMTKEGKTHFLLPIAKDLRGALKRLEEHCRKQNLQLSLVAVPESCRDYVGSVLGARVEEMEEGDFDYAYRSADLSALSGRRYNGQRNHLNRFRREHPNAEIRPLRREDRAQLREFLAQYRGAGGNETFLYDRRAVAEFVENFDGFDFLGAVVVCDEKIVGLAFGDVVGDTLFVHVEKFLRGISGLGETLNNGFVRLFARAGVDWVNREEDMGEEGLRKAKKSYYPTMRKKYRVFAPD